MVLFGVATPLLVVQPIKGREEQGFMIIPIYPQDLKEPHVPLIFFLSALFLLESPKSSS
jgi:hypothetical protein